jgi:hypothetical protein
MIKNNNLGGPGLRMIWENLNPLPVRSSAKYTWQPIRVRSIPLTLFHSNLLTESVRREVMGM